MYSYGIATDRYLE